MMLFFLYGEELGRYEIVENSWRKKQARESPPKTQNVLIADVLGPGITSFLHALVGSRLNRDEDIASGMNCHRGHTYFPR